MIGLCSWRHGHAKDLHQLFLGGLAAEGEGSPQVNHLHGHRPGLQVHQHSHFLLVLIALEGNTTVYNGCMVTSVH